MKKLLTIIALATALASFSACGGPEDESQTELDVIEDETATTTDAVNSSGQICHGVCRRGGLWPATINLCYPNITVNCRAQIVDACHRRGYNFVDAYWSFWGCG